MKCPYGRRMVDPCDRKVFTGRMNACQWCIDIHKASTDRTAAARLLGQAGGLASAIARTPEQRRERASRAGKASAAKMSPEARRERARKAGLARWEKERSK